MSVILTSPSHGPSDPLFRFLPVRFGTVIFNTTLWLVAL